MGMVFGLLVAVVLLCARASHQHVLQKIALVLLFAWSSSNVAVEVMGFARAPLAIPTLDAIAAVMIAVVGYRHRSNIAIVVFALYALVGWAHVAAFVLKAQETYTYYAALNCLFLAQLLVVGAPSAWLALHSRPAAGGERARDHRAHSPLVG